MPSDRELSCERRTMLLCLSRVVFGGCWQTSDGPLVEGRLLSGHALPRWCWVTGRQIVRRTTGSVSGSYRARPATQKLV